MKKRYDPIQKLYEDKGNRQAPPMQKVESIERIKTVPCDNGWLEGICGKVKACW